MKEKKLVPALVKADKLIRYIGQNKRASFTHIYEDLNLPKSSTYSLLITLEDLGFIRQIPSGEYAIGLKFFELGAMAADSLDLRAEARPIVKKLATDVQLTTHLGVLQGTCGTYIVKEEIEHQLQITSWEGKSIRLLSSGIGKALLAWQPVSLLEEILQKTKIEAHTTKTIVEPEKLIEELAIIRKRGWAIDDEEDGWGIRCVASVVRDMSTQVVASLSVCGTLHQIPDEKIQALAPMVLGACNELSNALGYQGQLNEMSCKK